MARTWNLRMNLDEFNALYGSAFTEQDKANVLVGLFVGCNGGTIPEQCPRSVHNAFTVGMAWRYEAEGFKLAKSEAGKASAEARKEKLGSANPRTNREQAVNSVHENCEQNVNQSTIHNPLTTNVQSGKTNSASRPHRATAKRKETPPIPEELLPFLEDLSSSWFKKSHDGRRVTRITPNETWKKICDNREQDEPRVCINAGLYYLELNDNNYAIGMDNFFGRDRKYTRYVVED